MTKQQAVETAGSSDDERGRPVLVLGSQSPARLSTLRAAGVDPVVRVSGLDEEAVVAALHEGGATPTAAEIVCAQAEAKALEVAGRVLAEADEVAEPRGTSLLLVVGCDSMLEINGRMVGKPGTPEIAKERIREMRGTDATLWTGHSLVPLTRDATGVWTVGAPLTEAAQTVVHFGQISDAEIDAYVATGEPLQVAGSFTIDALGGPFVEGVTGDPHSVVGISLPLLRALTDRAGVFWPDLWASPNSAAG